MTPGTIRRASVSPCPGTTTFGCDVTSTNDQLGASGAVGSVDEADPGVVLDRLGAGTGSALYTHDTAGSFWGEGDAQASTTCRRAPRDRSRRRGRLRYRRLTTVATSRRPPRGRRRSRWRKPVLIGAAALVCIVAVAGGVVAKMNKTVTISVDGVSQEVSTLSGSVDGALDAAGVTVAEHDTLAPAADAEITDGSQIVVRARPAADADRRRADPAGLDDRHHGGGGAGRAGPGSVGVQAVGQPVPRRSRSTG